VAQFGYVRCLEVKDSMQKPRRGGSQPLSVKNYRGSFIKLEVIYNEKY